MRIIYAYESSTRVPSPSLFLAGPSPRGKTHFNWRPHALEILEQLGFRGSVFVPLPRSGRWRRDYGGQVEWELAHLKKATVIVFWIPRHLRTLPAFTTNVEFGMFASSGKVVLGYPRSAVKMRYLAHIARKHGVPIRHTLERTLDAAIALTRT